MIEICSSHPLRDRAPILVRVCFWVAVARFASTLLGTSLRGSARRPSPAVNPGVVSIHSACRVDLASLIAILAGLLLPYRKFFPTQRVAP